MLPEVFIADKLSYVKLFEKTKFDFPSLCF